MEFLPWGALFLLTASAPLLGINSGSSSHSLLHTYMKESDQSLFTLSTYLDGKRITRYDNKKQSVEAVLPRVQLFLRNDSETNRREINHAKDAEEYFGLALYHLNKLYNQSSGIHVLQCLTNCSLGADGRAEWLIKCAYDRRDVRLHQDTFPRKPLEDVWEMTELWEVYRRESCPQTLCRWLKDGKRYLQETKTPEVELKAKEERNGFKTLFCRAYSFEPVMIRMAWKKDGRDWQAHTFHGIVAPNVDGTYYFWISVQVGPEEEGRYVCCVEHASLPEPLERTWEECVSVRQRFGIIFSVIVIPILLLVTTIYCKCFRQEKQTCQQSPAALSRELLDPRETLPGGETRAQEDGEGRPRDRWFCALCGKRYLSSIKKDWRGFSDKDFCSCPPVTLVEIPSK